MQLLLKHLALPYRHDKHLPYTHLTSPCATTPASSGWWALTDYCVCDIPQQLYSWQGGESKLDELERPGPQCLRSRRRVMNMTAPASSSRQARLPRLH